MRKNYDDKYHLGAGSASEGEVIVNGKKVMAPGPDRGVVYQTISLFPWLTTMGNVEYGPKIRGIKKQERREKLSIILI